MALCKCENRLMLAIHLYKILSTYILSILSETSYLFAWAFKKEALV